MKIDIDLKSGFLQNLKREVLDSLSVEERASADHCKVAVLANLHGHRKAVQAGMATVLCDVICALRAPMRVAAIRIAKMCVGRRGLQSLTNRVVVRDNQRGRLVTIYQKH